MKLLGTVGPLSARGQTAAFVNTATAAHHVKSSLRPRRTILLLHKDPLI